MAESMRNLHLVLVIGVMCVVQTMAEVCPYDSPLCSCSGADLTCAGLQEIPLLYTGPDVFNVTDLQFDAGNITSVTKYSLPPGLHAIGFSDNPLTNLAEDAFEASATTLREVSFNLAAFTSLPKALKKLTSLDDLTIIGTPISLWDIPTLTHISATLKSLTIIDTGISGWPSWLSNFPVLQKLILMYGNIMSVPENAFNTFNSLTEIYLGTNGLTQVPQAVYTRPILYKLDLSGNNLTDVTGFVQMASSPVSQTLDSIYLDTAGLTSMPNFANFTNLTYLMASNNIISDIPAGSLPVSLTHLLLSGNTLSSVPADIATMANLLLADLSKNRISSIGPNSFPSSMTRILLNYNNLTVITDTAFRNLNLLRRLNLGHNQISTVSPAAFSGLPSLQTLTFRNAHLTEIPLAFTQLSPQSRIAFSTVQPLTCSCPAPPELITWFQSLENTTLIQLSCITGRSIETYLSGQCGWPSDGR